VPGFLPRPQQDLLARRIAEALQSRHALVAEAGTGVGKTFAYLVPLLLSGRRALVSTATKSLQDQLFLRDLPRLAEVLGLPVRKVVIAVDAGRNLAVLVEAAVRNTVLQLRGIDTYQEFLRRHQAAMDKGAPE